MKHYYHNPTIAHGTKYLSERNGIDESDITRYVTRID